MTTEDYRNLWKQTLHLCEIEQNKDEASFFIGYYYHSERFKQLDERQLLLVFIGLVVYEEKFRFSCGSTSPAAWCYRELLNRVDTGKFDRELIYDIGDWAAKYSTNPYVPMGTRRNYGPRDYYKFEKEQEKRNAAESLAKEERIRKRIEEGKEKVEVAKKRHQDRLKTLNNLRNKNIPEALSYIIKSNKPIFYFIELVEEWLANENLSNEQKEIIMAKFPENSTRHNNRIKKQLLNTISQDEASCGKRNNNKTKLINV